LVCPEPISFDLNTQERGYRLKINKLKILSKSRELSIDFSEDSYKWHKHHTRERRKGSKYLLSGMANIGKLIRNIQLTWEKSLGVMNI
jgi:hypothetical protein